MTDGLTAQGNEMWHNVFPNGGISNNAQPSSQAPIHGSWNGVDHTRINALKCDDSLSRDADDADPDILFQLLSAQAAKTQQQSTEELANGGHLSLVLNTREGPAQVSLEEVSSGSYSNEDLDASDDTGSTGKTG
jgi:hypothetical protein